ncbi:MAG TPA: MFS transporter [Ensifer sp.]|nr:MFS transporter [Ensifer sp.]
MIGWIFGLSAAYAIALGGTTVMPILVLSMSKLAGYDEALATLVASAELVGIAVFGLLTPKLALKPSRALAAISLIAVLGGNIASFYVPTPLLLAAARFVTGLAEGAIFSLVCMSLASRANAERLWGALSLFGGLAMGAELVVISLVTQQWTDVPIFLMLAGFTLAMAPLLWLISSRQMAVVVASEQSKLAGGKMTAAIGAIFLVYMVQSAEWSVCGFIGEKVGLSTAQVGFYLAISSVAGFLGAVVPATMHDNAKRLPFVVAGMMLMGVSIYFLFNVFTFSAFVLAQILVNVGFYIVTPFLTGVVTENDRDGTLMSRVLVVAVLGAAVGTGAAGPIFANAGSSDFAWYCLAPLALAALCASLVFGHLHRIHRLGSAQLRSEAHD